MWWREQHKSWRLAGRLAVVLAAASLTAGCFEPLYGHHAATGSESVRDKLAAIQIPVITAPNGQPVARIAVAMRNALQFDLNGGAGANAPTHILTVGVSLTSASVIVDVTSGRPDAQLEGVTASYTLKEIATGKVVVSDTTFAHVDYDVPGSAQRFAAQRAQRDADDRAVQVVAETIRNRLASYFVAGT
jgi:LPS-assembly lipoprotein